MSVMKSKRTPTCRPFTPPLPETYWSMQIYQACEREGRIAYKRSGGSRLITQNDHWKSQIRHALYTCDRFIRYLPHSQQTRPCPVLGGLSTTNICVQHAVSTHCCCSISTAYH